MKDKTYRLGALFFISIMLIYISFLGCNYSSEEYKRKVEKKKEVKDTSVKENRKSHKEIAVTPPPFSEGIFPCSQCHINHVTNTERRDLKIHDSISSIFNHDSENRWCLDCHSAKNRDYLVLASGKLLDFKESYKLCGQCHGDKYRDWKVGVHGKRTGFWNGDKQYLLCVSCHNPHSPGFKKIKPLPAPKQKENVY